MKKKSMTKHFISYFRNGALKYSTEIYKNQPGRIEDYEPGRSSIAEKEAKEVHFIACDSKLDESPACTIKLKRTFPYNIRKIRL